MYCDLPRVCFLFYCSMSFCTDLDVLHVIVLAFLNYCAYGVYCILIRRFVIQFVDCELAAAAAYFTRFPELAVAAVVST